MNDVNPDSSGRMCCVWRPVGFVALIFSVLLSVPGWGQSKSVKAVGNDLNTVRQEIVTTQKVIQNQGIKIRKAQREVEASQRAIKLADQALKRIRQKQYKTLKQLKVQQKELESIHQDVSARRASLMRGIRGQYVLLRRQESGRDVQNRKDVIYIRSVIRKMENQINELLLLEQRTNIAVREIKDKLKKLNTEGRVALAQRRKLDQKQGKRQKEIKKISGSVRENKKKLAQLEVNERQLNQLMDRLVKEAEVRRQAELEAHRHRILAEKKRQERLERQKAKQLEEYLASGDVLPREFSTEGNNPSEKVTKNGNIAGACAW